jgi:class 3 adenylate cyclase
MILTALDMQYAVSNIVDKDGQNFWKLKMAIHTGPVVATVNEGKNNPLSLTGDSVNIASRMGEATPDGTICVSIMTYELIKEFFECNLIGKMPVKYKGDLGMFDVPGILPDLRENNIYYLPNQNFLTKYHHSKFM